MIIKNGLVTDTSKANIIFLKSDKIFTPNSPLLNGTKRQEMIKYHHLIPIEIKIDDIFHFEKWKIINALNSFDDNQWQNIENII